MPQMAPLNWLTLFLYFTFMFMLINPLNYFLHMRSVSSPKSMNKQRNINWKW